jgi:hypothetical protein
MAKNQALAEFDNEEHDLSEFNSWYSPDILKYLSHLNGQVDFLRYVFFDDVDSINAFKEQIKSLTWLNKDFAFICKEPGAGNNHFIFGLIFAFAKEKKLVIINPVGETAHAGFYEVLANISKSLNLSIYVSETTIQRDGNDGLVSCGPICAELMRHISMLSKNQILEAIDQQVESKTYTKELADKNIKLEYQSFSLTGEILPNFFKTLPEEQGQEYQDHMTSIRSSHRDILESDHRLKGSIEEQNKYLDSKCINHPVQVGVFRYTQGDTDLVTAAKDINNYLIPVSKDSYIVDEDYKKESEEAILESGNTKLIRKDIEKFVQSQLKNRFGEFNSAIPEGYLIEQIKEIIQAYKAKSQEEIFLLKEQLGNNIGNYNSILPVSIETCCQLIDEINASELYEVMEAGNMLSSEGKEGSDTEYKGYDSAEQHEKLSDIKHKVINNPGGGDCGVYTLIDAIHGSESQYGIQEEIRSNITNTIKNFIVPFLVKTPGFSRERLQSLCYNFTVLVISDTV